MEPRLLVGATQRGWVTGLTHWVSEHGGAQLVGQALTPSDVTEADFDVLVLDSWSSLLTRRLIDEVQRDGRAVMVLVNADRPDAEESRLRDLGISLSFPITCEAEQIVSRATEAAAVRQQIQSRDAVVESAVPPSSLAEDQANRLLVVVGHKACEVAVNVAVALTPSSGSVALIDLDTVEPSVAQRLDLPLLPNVLTAADHLRNGRFGSASVRSHATGVDVIAGLANPREWDELSLADTIELIDGVREQYLASVAVVHHLLEDLAPLSGLAGRFDVGRYTVEKADEVLIVGEQSPVGLTRLLGTIADVRGLTRAPVHVVVTDATPDGFRQAEFTREVERSFTPESLWFLPHDTRVSRAAWDGRVPSHGRFGKAVGRIADHLARGRAA